MKRSQNALLLFILVLFSALPPLGQGFWALNQAQQAHPTDYAQKSHFYEVAARRLPWRADLYDEAGQNALQQKDLPRAIALLREAQRKNALSPQGQWALANALHQNQQPEEALLLWEDLQARGTLLNLVLPRLAEEYHLRSRFADEEKTLQAWLQAEPQNAQARTRLGILQLPYQPGLALSNLVTLGESSPALAKMLQNLQNSLQPGQPAYLPALLSGQILASQEEWILARLAFDYANQQAGGNFGTALGWLALSLHKTGQPAAAEKLFKQALAAEDSALLHALYALHLEENRNLPQATVEFQQAQQREPQNPAWQMALGRVISQSDLAQALTHYQNATALAPQDPQTWHALAAFCAEQQSYLEIGLQAALRAYALAPSDPQSGELLARLLMAVGETESAAALLQQNAIAQPQDPAPLFYLGILHLQTGESAAARDYLQRALALAPQGEYSQAIEKILQADTP